MWPCGPSSDMGQGQLFSALEVGNLFPDSLSRALHADYMEEHKKISDILFSKCMMASM